MRCFCITLTRVSHSILLAERCVRSARQFSIDVEIFDAVDKHNIVAVQRELGLRYTYPLIINGDIAATKACFASHFLLWQRCVSLNEILLIVEHDAMFQHPIPQNLLFDQILYVSEPCWSEAVANYSKISNGVQAYPFEYFIGTYGYAVTPLGAATLICMTKQQGMAPVDGFISTKNFPNLQILKPALVKHINTVGKSTIQFSKRKTTSERIRYMLQEIESKNNSLPADKLLKVYLYTAWKLCRHANFCFASKLIWKSIKLKVKGSQ